MKSLRSKIVAGVCGSAFVVFALTFALIGGILQFTTQDRLDGITELINKNGGEMPAKAQYDLMNEADRIFMYNFTEEAPYIVRYFIVEFEENGAVDVSSDHIASVSQEQAVQMANDVVGGSSTGYYDNYRYRVSGDTVIFLDCSAEMDNVRFVLRITAMVEILFVILITAVFYALSDRLVKPFENNAKAQRRFITDASHELKTPVAIIQANAEVLAYKNGENEWLSNISAQTDRMGSLVNELLVLSRLEEIDENVDMGKVDFGEIVLRTVSEFGEVFDGKGVSVQCDVPPDTVIVGNRTQLERLASVIVENASKYVDEGGAVQVGLKRAHRNVVLTVFNECQIDEDVDYSHLFDRFYRPDSSRTSETGGHGIGLSIARRITQLHDGEIEARPSKDGMTFVVTLSARLKASKPANTGK